MSPPSSPFKKKVSKTSTKIGKAGDELVCYGFYPTVYELFSFSKVKKGQVYDGYTYPFRKFIDGDDELFQFPHLEEAGFVGYYVMRKSPDSEERLDGPDGYPRHWMVRCVPGGNPTSSETRLEGLNILSHFFKSPKVSKYPPASIRLDDLTPSVPKALNFFLRDSDIFSLLECSFEKSALTPNFVTKFPEIAKVIFSGPTYPPSAKNLLGYGPQNPLNGRGGSYVPGFHPPEVRSTENEAPSVDEEEKEEKEVVEENTEEDNVEETPGESEEKDDENSEKAEHSDDDKKTPAKKATRSKRARTT